MATVQDCNTVATSIITSAYTQMVVLVSRGLFYGVVLSLYCITFVHIGSKPNRWLQASLCAGVLILATVHFAGDTAASLHTFAFVLDPITSGTLEDRYQAAKQDTINVKLAAGFIGNFLTLAGDAIVVWRATVLWPHSRRVRCALWFLLAIQTCIAIFDGIFDTISVLRASDAGANSATAKVDFAFFMVSVIINVIATICIAVRCWTLRTGLKQAFKRTPTRRSTVYPILITLVELGLLLCMFQVLNAVLFKIAPTTNGFAVAVLESFTTYFIAVYPCLVILALASKRSILEQVTIELNSTMALGGSTTTTTNNQSPDPRRLETLHFAPHLASSSNGATTTTSGVPHLNRLGGGGVRTAALEKRSSSSGDETSSGGRPSTVDEKKEKVSGGMV